MSQYIVQTARYEHLQLADEICRHMEESAKARGTGIAKRSPDYIKQKMVEGKAVVATTADGKFVGFCYIESWGHGKFVANSGLIVHPDHRKSGIAKEIKQKIFDLTRKKYPAAKIFGITTSLAVMRINSALGYKPVTFSELTDDDNFWKGCASCTNYDVLTRTNRKMCLCTGMLYDPVEEEKPNKKKPWDVAKQSKLYERWLRFKNHVLFKKDKPADEGDAGQPKEKESEKVLVYSILAVALGCAIYLAA
ncbi:MAG: N-acetyl-L-citrulline:glutamate N-acetyltransferase [uncultured Cytophagales bacterium]|uniref:N-acetyl-L-citrulline:glutamate N-acetyltransferase n=1 Tax=uncultured Cytophagales bacterium TaxID=158755 RepID=A0A6J4KLE8_9SPHI|nr:MAG: N-acetyl-L-citrulline:glutamate N-acetyltransferase [uncultured Cytophagales bacterium]